MRWLALAMIVVACGGHHFDASEARDVTASAAAVGSLAPGGELVDASGKRVALAAVIGAHERTIVTFYRGFY